MAGCGYNVNGILEDGRSHVLDPVNKGIVVEIRS